MVHSLAFLPYLWGNKPLTWSTGRKWANRNLCFWALLPALAVNLGITVLFLGVRIYWKYILQCHEDHLKFYLMCFISTCSPASSIQDQEFKGFYLVGYNPLVLVAGISTNASCSGRVEVGKTMHSGNSHLPAGEGTTEHTAWFGGPFFLYLRVYLDLRIGLISCFRLSRTHLICSQENQFWESLLPLKTFFWQWTWSTIYFP